MTTISAFSYSSRPVTILATTVSPEWSAGSLYGNRLAVRPSTASRATAMSHWCPKIRTSLAGASPVLMMATLASMTSGRLSVKRESVYWASKSILARGLSSHRMTKTTNAETSAETGATASHSMPVSISGTQSSPVRSVDPESKRPGG